MIMSAYQNNFDRVCLQFLLPSWGSLQYSMMKIERVVTINNTKMIAQSCQENGLKNIQNWISPLDWSGTTIWRLDCIYGWVKSTNFDRSAVIVKSATTPSASYDHPWNINIVKTNANIIVEHIINPQSNQCKISVSSTGNNESHYSLVVYLWDLLSPYTTKLLSEVMEL